MQEEFSNEIRTIARFFFFALLDENKALKVSRAVVGQFLRKIREQHSPEDRIQLVCDLTHDFFEKEKKSLVRGHSEISFEKGWTKSPLLDFSIWLKFHKESKYEELICVIWVHILEIPVSVVSKTLMISPSSVLYRVSRGVRLLSQANPRQDVASEH